MVAQYLEKGKLKQLMVKVIFNKYDAFEIKYQEWYDDSTFIWKENCECVKKLEK